MYNIIRMPDHLDPGTGLTDLNKKQVGPSVLFRVLNPTCLVGFG